MVVVVVLLYLIGTCDDPGKVPFLLVLTLDNGFHDGGVVGAQVDEDMCDTSLQQYQLSDSWELGTMGKSYLPNGLEESERSGIFPAARQLVNSCGQ